MLLPNLSKELAQYDWRSFVSLFQGGIPASCNALTLNTGQRQANSVVSFSNAASVRHKLLNFCCNSTSRAAASTRYQSFSAFVRSAAIWASQALNVTHK